MILEQIHTIEDYAKFYLQAPANQPICRGGNLCQVELELIIISPLEKYVFCPKCRAKGLSSGIPRRLMDWRKTI